MAVRGEEIEQARLIKWSHKKAVREMMPDLEWLYHTPNGGRRDSFAAAQMKALGVKRGVPDLLLPVRVTGEHGGRAGLVIEMKSADGRLTAEQENWIAHYAAEGWATVIARSAEEARAAICYYLGWEPKDVPEL